MTAYYKLDHSEPGYLSQMLPRADGSWVKRADYEADLAAARAEIERLNNALTEAANQISDLASQLGQAEGRLVASELVRVVEGWKDRAEKAEAERDEALAEIKSLTIAASSWEYAARQLEFERNRAKSALEAYGREKAREGMKRAAEIIRGSCPECQGTGLRDSGGVQPWGEPISVPCDCTDAIPEAYEREKVLEGMQRVIDRLRLEGQINPSLTYADAIEWAEYVLAAMEKEGGK